MPYIQPERREKYQHHINELANLLSDQHLSDLNSKKIYGDLNFVITSILLRFFNQQGGPFNYFDLSQAVAALECAKLELYRRVGGPTEESAIERNGDIYE